MILVAVQVLFLRNFLSCHFRFHIKKIVRFLALFFNLTRKLDLKLSAHRRVTFLHLLQFKERVSEFKFFGE